MIDKHKKLVLIALVLVFISTVPLMRVSAATTITVNSTADDQDNDGECTLREAIVAANTDVVSGAAGGECAAGSGAGDIVEFDIAGAGPHTIAPISSLPVLTTEMTIDGYTETGAIANTAVSPAPFNGTLMIEIDGTSATGNCMLALGATNVVVRGLVINNCAEDGIRFGSNSDNARLEGSYIGTDVDGLVDEGSDGTGISISDSNNVILGGTDPEDRNIIAGNQTNDVLITSASADPSPMSGTTVHGNYIGLGADGTTAIPAGSAFGQGNALLLSNSHNDQIGGTATGTKNVMGSSDEYGVAFRDGTSGTIVEGNYIGTDYTGNATMTHSLGTGNVTGGVHVGIVTGFGYALIPQDITIGGSTSASRNVISGNSYTGGSDTYGVLVDDGAHTVTISGNYVGLGADGSTDLGNEGFGVGVDADDVTIGGSTSGMGNVISNNGTQGVNVYGGDNAIVQGNIIGLRANGITSASNTSDGVLVADATNATIGGTATDASNTISSNGGDGVAVTGASALDNLILGNSIFSNSGIGIDLGSNGVTVNDAGDGDSGPNDLLNYPVWGLFNDDGPDTEITYDLDVPAGDYRIEFFSGDGTTLLESQNITHTGSGTENFSNTLTGTGHTGLRMTATEINAGNPTGFGPTSEFSDRYSDGSATITVNSTADDEDDDGECTLREAIKAANDDTESGVSVGECAAGALVDTIEFDIAGAGPHTIQPSSGLPSITANNLIIDGYSETGAIENSGDYSACFVGTIMIEIDGTNVVGGNGLTVSANDVTVRGLAINRFDGDGIGISTVDGTVISGNMLGTDVDGLIDRGNGDAGVTVDSTGDTMIGGTTAADRNLISGNEGFGGVELYSDAGTTTVSGNCIGTDATGDTAIPNSNNGINIYQAGANIIIGGDTTHERNIISGNDASGIAADESSIDNIIGNYIGTNVDGATDLGNGDNGIYIDGDASVSYIGGLTSGERNIISGNEDQGIQLVDGAEDTQIRGNYIGLGANGSTDLGNTGAGVLIQSDNNTLGGTVSGARNVISGNSGTSIALNGGDSNTIQGNYVGLDATGLNAITSCTATNSVHIYVQSNNNIVGGSTNSARNVIGQCGFANGACVQILGGFGTVTSGNTVQGNYVGTDKNGDTLGVVLAAGINLVADTDNNMIGGDADGEGNLVRGMGGGIAVVELEPLAAPTNNTIIGNSIYENDGGYFTELGIDLLESPDFGNTLVQNGVTANDGGDADSGSNDYLNYPVIDSVTASTGEFDVQFDLDVPDDAPNGYRIEFFANDTGDTSGNGEGQIYLGFANVAGSGNNQTATITLDPGVIDSGTYDIAATTTERDNSTDTFGATSEFSAFVNNQEIIAPLDNDGDGVNDSIEDAGPNGGDGNDDGTPDSDQVGVASILDAEGDDYITLVLDPDGTCTDIGDFSSVLESQLSKLDPDYIYDLTLVEFTIPCADSVDGTIYWHGEDNFSTHTYRKFGPTTPGNVSTSNWYNASSAGFSEGTATVNGNTVATANFSLTDGQLGDDTGNDDSIVDANGPGLDQPTSISETAGDILSNTGSNQYVYIITALTLMFGSIVVLKKKYLQ